jgi:protoporphyrinogen/coproporphyrinogen III oxidase
VSAGGSVIVAGGGPAGLAAAFRLQRAGHTVRVLEASDRAGSKLSSERSDGFLIDRGAFFIPTTHRDFIGLARDAGIADDLVPGGFGFGIARAEEIHQLDGDHLLRDFARSDVVSLRGKLGAIKLAPELLRARRATVDRIEEAGRYDTETLAAWAERTLNPELAGFVIDPALRAIFATEADEVSRVELLGMLALFGGAKLVAFRDGMAHYAERLSAQLDVVTDAQVLSVRQLDGGAEVAWRDAAGTERTESTAGCVVALPAQLAIGILPGLDAWRRGYMERVRRGRLLLAHVGLSTPPPGIGATYTMIPRAEHPFLGGIVCDHNKAPGRAPHGKGLLTLALSNPWCERHWEEDDESVITASMEALERFMPGSRDGAEFVQLSRWRQQYVSVGHYAGLAEFQARSAAHDSTVQLAGEYLSSPHLSAATAAGERAAAALATAMEARAPGAERVTA